MNGVWYECPLVMRFAWPAGRVHHTRVTGYVKAVFGREIRFQSVMKPAKPIDVQNVE